MSALSSVSIRRTLFPMHCFLSACNRHFFVCTEFRVHQTDNVSYELSSVSIRQTMFRMHWVLCPSDRHCFLWTEFRVHQTDNVSYALSSMSIRQTLFPMHLSSVSIIHMVSYALRFLSFRKILLPTRMTLSWYAAKQRMERDIIIGRCLQSRCDKRRKRIGLFYIQVELERLYLEMTSSLCFPAAAWTIHGQ
jgi:hypothetical protein